MHHAYIIWCSTSCTASPSWSPFWHCPFIASFQALKTLAAAESTPTHFKKLPVFVLRTPCSENKQLNFPHWASPSHDAGQTSFCEEGSGYLFILLSLHHTCSVIYTVEQHNSSPQGSHCAPVNIFREGQKDKPSTEELLAGSSNPAKFVSLPTSTYSLSSHTGIMRSRQAYLSIWFVGGHADNCDTQHSCTQEGDWPLL